VQERLEAAAAHPPLVDQRPRDLDAVARVELVEAEHRRQDPVDRRRRPRRAPAREHDDVVGRLA
jgi:hypothetical protein